MSDRKYQFSVGEVLLWLSLFAMALALRFDPHLPFLVTMLGLGLALAIRMRHSPKSNCGLWMNSGVAVFPQIVTLRPSKAPCTVSGVARWVMVR